MKKNVWIVLVLLILFTTACGTQEIDDSDSTEQTTDFPSEKSANDESITDEEKKEILHEDAVTNYLPLTFEIFEHDTELTTIAYRLWFDLMGAMEESGQISDAFFTRYSVLEGNEAEFIAVVDFQVHFLEGQDTSDSDQSEAQEERIVDDIVWKLTISKESESTYTLKSIEPSADKYIGLPPIQSMEEYQEEAGIVVDENNRYEIVDDMLRVTYNNGRDWTDTPVEINTLFEGEYQGSKSNLIDGSYMIHPERTAFIIGGNQDLRITYSEDQGQTWEEATVADQVVGVRMRILDFTSDLVGYVVVTAGRTMSSEGNLIFKTTDGGKTWTQATSAEEMSLLTDGGFVNDELGFLSFGSHKTVDEPPRPMLYRTDDGANSWEEVEIPIPEEFKGIFTVAEMPIFHGTHGTLLVNQGPEGDYLGGNVVAKFISSDNGKTWDFSSLVDPDHVLLQ
ncbi:WD40/YVTN/BNR-like repeat-containing protein [Ornithinibacillus salinisoli]|uniref:WD40/YVTN/BNR-like repeat-containing protein n=1 Tax=Ornithinibacillus salinisoli TaxID=1848459 RepID=A0ABW4VYL5_9BACI